MGCAATLVSSKHVITAAHCLDQSEAKTEELAMQFGVHNKSATVCYSNPNGVGCSGTYKSFEAEAGLIHLPHKLVGVAKVIKHPNWSGRTYRVKILKFIFEPCYHKCTNQSSF